MIYFVRGGDPGVVKIGYTTDIRSRLASLQTASPEALEVLRLVAGSARYEKELHARFRDDHVRGEWFRLSPEVLTYIHDTERQDVREEGLTIPDSWRTPGLHTCLGCGFNYDGSEAREHAEHHRAWLDASAAHGRVRTYAELEAAKAAAWRSLDVGATPEAIATIARAHFEERALKHPNEPWLKFARRYMNPALTGRYAEAFRAWRESLAHEDLR